MMNLGAGTGWVQSFHRDTGISAVLRWFWGLGIRDQRAARPAGWRLHDAAAAVWPRLCLAQRLLGQMLKSCLLAALARAALRRPSPGPFGPRGGRRKLGVPGLLLQKGQGAGGG